MNPRNAETLYALCAGLRLHMPQGAPEVLGITAEWFRPMDVGGTDGSHHSQTLRRLAKRGWVEAAPRHGLAGARLHSRYRITLEGVRALANHSAQKGDVSPLGRVEAGPDGPGARSGPA